MCSPSCRALVRSRSETEVVESPRSRAEGLGLIAMTTRFRPDKARHRVTGRALQGGCRVVGYEIHMGETTLDPGVSPWFCLKRERDGTTVMDGMADPADPVFLSTLKVPAEGSHRDQLRGTIASRIPAP